jgi:hypothetical protein
VQDACKKKQPQKMYKKGEQAMLEAHVQWKCPSKGKTPFSLAARGEGGDAEKRKDASLLPGSKALTSLK